MKNQTKFKDTEIGRIPEDWDVSELGDVVDVKSGFAFKSGDFSDFGIPVIKIKNITSPKVSLDEVDYYNGTVNEQLSSYIIKKDDILISLTGSHINQLASAVGEIARYQHSKPALLNQRVGKIYVIINEKLYDSFLYYYLIQKKIQLELVLNAGGSANQANISPSQIKNLLLPLPKLIEQQSIAKILSDLDSKIELNQQMNKTLETIGQAIFKRWFIDFEFPNEDGKPYKSSGGEMVDSELGEIPKRWEVMPIDQIANFLNGLALQKYPQKGEAYIPAIKIREMRQGITESSDKASPDIDKEYIVNDGDILFSWSGSLDICIWCGGIGALNQHLFKVTSQKYPKWLFYQWVRHYLPEFQYIAEGKATTMGHIQRHHLSEALVIVPPNKTIEKMNDLMNPLLDRFIVNDIESRKLSQIRDSLLPKLMSGKIRVNVERDDQI